MAPSFSEIINSRLFKFIVGETIDGKPTEFSIHEEAIAHLSKPLHTLVKGDLSEAQTGCTIWRDVSKETFERFVQFAYTGDYSIPDAMEKGWGKKTSKSMMRKTKKSKKTNRGASLAVLMPVIDVEPEAVSEVYPKNPAGEYELPKYPLPETPELSTIEFKSLEYPLILPRNMYSDDCEPAWIPAFGRSYSNVFLTHASLYVLGDYWLIDGLKALALYKLHKTLCMFNLAGNISDIVDLIRCAYNEEGKGFEEGIGRLRNMVCRYVAPKAPEFSSHDGFMELLAEGGEFVKDLFKFVIQEIK